MDGADVALMCDGGGAPMQHEQRFSGRQPDHFDVLPTARRAHTGPQRFEKCFLGGEARGQRMRRIGMRCRVIQFRRRKKSARALLPAAFEKGREAWNFNQVEAGTQNHRANISKTVRISRNRITFGMPPPEMAFLLHFLRTTTRTRQTN
jgi:hypothetical protein